MTKRGLRFHVWMVAMATLVHSVVGPSAIVEATDLDRYAARLNHAHVIGLSTFGYDTEPDAFPPVSILIPAVATPH